MNIQARFMPRLLLTTVAYGLICFLNLRGMQHDLEASANQTDRRAIFDTERICLESEFYPGAIGATKEIERVYGIEGLNMIKTLVTFAIHTPTTPDAQRFIAWFDKQLGGSAPISASQSTTSIVSAPEQQTDTTIQQKQLTWQDAFTNSRVAPHLYDTIIETLAREWIAKAPAITIGQLYEYYKDEEKPVLPPNLRSSLHARIQELRKNNIFLVNTTGKQLDVGVGIDNEPDFAIPPIPQWHYSEIAARWTLTPRTLDHHAIIQTQYSIPAGGVQIIAWDPRLNKSAFIRTIGKNEPIFKIPGAVFAKKATQITPGNVLFLDIQKIKQPMDSSPTEMVNVICIKQIGHGQIISRKYDIPIKGTILKIIKKALEKEKTFPIAEKLTHLMIHEYGNEAVELMIHVLYNELFNGSQDVILRIRRLMDSINARQAEIIRLQTLARTSSPPPGPTH